MLKMVFTTFVKSTITGVAYIVSGTIFFDQGAGDTAAPVIFPGSIEKITCYRSIQLLRVRHCYRSCSPEGNHLCLYRGQIFALLKLDYLELRRERDSSLVLFYHKEALCTVLAHPENQAVLGPHGYPFCGPIELFLDVLKQRFRSEHIPHEVGAFLGYPAKDVLGFIGKLPKTPVSGGNWQVFGDAEESVARMQLYRRVERMARNLLDRSDNLEIFFNHLTKFYRKDRRLANG